MFINYRYPLPNKTEKSKIASTKYRHLARIAGIEVLDLQFAVDLSADLGGDGVSIVVGDDGSVAVPLHVGLGHSVAAHLQRDVVVVLHRLLLQRLREHWRSG